MGGSLADAQPAEEAPVTLDFDGVISRHLTLDSALPFALDYVRRHRDAMPVTEYSGKAFQLMVARFGDVIEGHWTCVATVNTCRP